MLMASEILWNIMKDKKLSGNWCMGDRRAMYEARNVVTRVFFFADKGCGCFIIVVSRQRGSHRISETATRNLLCITELIREPLTLSKSQSVPHADTRMLFAFEFGTRKDFSTGARKNANLWGLILDLYMYSTTALLKENNNGIFSF